MKKEKQIKKDEKAIDNIGKVGVIGSDEVEKALEVLKK